MKSTTGICGGGKPANADTHASACDILKAEKINCLLPDDL